MNICSTYSSIGLSRFRLLLLLLLFLHLFTGAELRRRGGFHGSPGAPSLAEDRGDALCTAWLAASSIDFVDEPEWLREGKKTPSKRHEYPRSNITLVGTYTGIYSQPLYKCNVSYTSHFINHTQAGEMHLVYIDTKSMLKMKIHSYYAKVPTPCVRSFCQFLGAWGTTYT